MAVFTVHMPAASAGETPQQERIVLLRDGLSVPAFVFGPFWLAWNRAWIPAVLWGAALVALRYVEPLLGLSREGVFFIGLASSLLLGFEGSQIVAWALAREGLGERAVVLADDLDEAEESFFREWRPGAQNAAAAPPPAGETRA
jgi:hypothetical protein